LYPQFTALKLFPQTSEVDPGAETVTYYILVGENWTTILRS